MCVTWICGAISSRVTLRSAEVKPEVAIPREASQCSRALQHDSITLRAGGFDLHADVWNGGESRQILLLHGLGGNTITWHGVAPVLAGALHARVLALDLPGFGASHPQGKSLGFSVLSRVVVDVLREQAPAGSGYRCTFPVGACAAKIETCASSGSMIPKIFWSVRRWTQLDQLSK